MMPAGGRFPTMNHPVGRQAHESRILPMRGRKLLPLADPRLSSARNRPIRRNSKDFLPEAQEQAPLE